MWMRLQILDVNGDITDVGALSPAPLGILCDVDVVKEAIRKYLNCSEVTISLCASSQPYFAGRLVEGVVACFAVTYMDGERYTGEHSFLVVWE